MERSIWAHTCQDVHAIAMSNLPNLTHDPAHGPAADTVAIATDAEKALASAPTPLAARLSESASLPIREHLGTQSVAAFAEGPSELAALLSSAGIYDLGGRGFVRCTGEDRVRWLNGMVTNSVAGLAANTGCYAFVLNAQGRIQGDLSIFQRADALWLETDQAQVASLMAFLDHYIIMDDVALERADTITAVGIAGPHAIEVLAAAGFSVTTLASMQLAEISWRDRPIALIAAHSPRVPRYEIWCSATDVLQIWDALAQAGAVRCGGDATEELRILEGSPAYSVDITSRDLPQETSQMRALHFAKGCYLGQEIVERIRSRGNVHRTLSGFVVEDDAFPLPEPGTKVPLLAEGQPVGELTSIARIAFPGSTGRILALGTIRREALERKAVLTAAGSPVTSAALPFDFPPI